MATPNGHRAIYQALLSERLGLARSTGTIGPRRAWMLLRARNLVFATLDDQPLGFFAVALARAVARRRTVALMLRPQACFEASRPNSHARRLAFAALRRVPGIAVLTIVPFAVRACYAQVATGWLHDPQSWDGFGLGGAGHWPATPLSETVRAMAGGRAVLAALGTVTPIKGLARLLSMVDRDPACADRFVVVIAGRVAPECRPLVRALQRRGALVFDRFVTDRELASLYGIARFVWCCYQPRYDQASGVFGRAVQAGAIPIVRDGSVIADLARAMGWPHLPVAWDRPAPLGAVLEAAPSTAPGPSDARITALAQQGLRTIARSLGP
ncbi:MULTISPECIES: hypothetical protein [unclassified Roseitalea]|uniref:hypothetical protein n=1 Tax=unclassified Roseitalea TaxID=2639107 RepID=UPI00273D1CD9|nr:MULTISPECIES: hypothetical protein [unclassified Roseitalea]